MNTQVFRFTILSIFFAVAPFSLFGQLEELKRLAEEKAKAKVLKELIEKYEKGQPISTTFDDADYEAIFLDDFEPSENEFQPLSIQPRLENGGGYKLQSGIYTMNARSFCLRGYTHGPSKGDGHLYAPLKGKKADFVQSIIQHYAIKPDPPQQDVQVLLWAIIAGADMKTLGNQYSKTLTALFSNEELIKLQAQGFLDTEIEKTTQEIKRYVAGKVPDKLQELFDADDKIRTLVSGNRTFQEIEKIAVIPGIAPRDMIREVSKGRWSYHPNGYFVRFFPNGYPQTRVDVYVPYKDAVQKNKKGKASGINKSANEPVEVIFDPSGMVASPANRPSQRIGVSPVPVDDIDCLELIKSWLPGVGSLRNPLEEVDCSKRKVDWIKDDEIAKFVSLFQTQGYHNIEVGNSYDLNSGNYHCYYVENEICDKSLCPNCTEENVFQTLLQSAKYAAPTDQNHSVSNLAVTDVNIPCQPDNPIATTIHPDEKAIINYTLSYYETKIGRAGVVPYSVRHTHFLHPGKVQRKIFTEGTKIKMSTMGEGSGRMPEVNLEYAIRTWGTVDNRLINALKCK